ncbi:MAG: [FeFe] hydrogenase H-cluster maturation GTPase HydF [Alphaproteobacteria bacterium]
MQNTQSGLRKKVVFVGEVNSGKSSLINAIIGENVSIVSEVKGTTTDSLSRAFELLGYGAVTMCDTAGFGDDTELGEKRQKVSLDVLKTADLAILVTQSTDLTSTDFETLNKIKSLNKQYIIVHNKSDVNNYQNTNKLCVSAKTEQGLEELKSQIIEKLKQSSQKRILDGIVNAGDSVLLVMPQDSSAPEGRLILPQVQVIRECIDRHVIVTCVALEELAVALKKANYDLVITDTQVIKQVLETVSDSQKVSTFSVLFGKAKGDIEVFLKGVERIDTLRENDTVLIAEACVHTTNQDDIAKFMIPRIMQQYTGKKLNFEFISGKKILDNVKGAKLIVQCGGCMLTPEEMQQRIISANDFDVPITNYGLTITKCQAKDINRLTF